MAEADKLAKVKRLRKSGDAGAEAAQILLIALSDEFPENAEILAEVAFVHDQLGLEATAVAYY